MGIMAEFFDLDGNSVQEKQWSELFRGPDRFLARDDLTNLGLEVSTVWIGISWGEEEPPLIFETMVFSFDEDHRWCDLGCWRWATKEEALDGHRKIVDGIMSGTVELRSIDHSPDECI